jgi:hypothetical protein
MKAADALMWAQQNASPIDPIADYVDNLFIVDYGIVRGVNIDGTIDVAHAKRLTLKTGEYLPESITEQIEVLWPSVGDFSFRASLNVGDKVLLLGLKNYLRTVDIDDTSDQDLYYAYSRETLKALPYCVFNSSASVVVEVVDSDLAIDTNAGKVSLKNTARNLKLLIDEFIDDLTTMSAALAVNGSPLWPSGATTFPALKAKYAQLFKE